MLFRILFCVVIFFVEISKFILIFSDESQRSMSNATRTPPMKHKKGDKTSRPVPPTRTVTANHRSDSFSGKIKG